MRAAQELGVATRAVLGLLRDYESRNVTFIDPSFAWPIVWERAKGVHVWDADGRRYLDLTAAFGVAATGHANSEVVRAGQAQMGKLLHAMGDVHPHRLKAALARELSRLTFERWSHLDFKSQFSNLKSAARSKIIFCNSGFEAVEAALKTALLATGKRRVIAFERGYHGLGYGALNATHRRFFRGPFEPQLGLFGEFVPFPTEARQLEATEKTIRSLARRHRLGAVLVEPVQGRGGIHVPPSDFLPRLRLLCNEIGALLILDEVYTGFGRTGRWFACEHSGTIPDLICLGKALTGGFPLSACVGRADLMDAAWPASKGEAIHTSTFLGHPVGCAMALAQIKEIEQHKLVERSAHLGRHLCAALAALGHFGTLRLSVRGLGLMLGLELGSRRGLPARLAAMQVIKRMLNRGFILLPEGEDSNVISFTPPLTITARQLDATVATLGEVLREAGG